MNETTDGISTDSTQGGEDSVAMPTRLFVLGMAHRDGSLHSQELQSVAVAVSISPDQLRSCLRRLVTEGIFDRTGEGRDATWQATEEGLAVLDSNRQRHLLAYAQDAAGRGWDRTWRLVAFAIPETNRAARDHFRDRLLALGAAPVHNGLYVSPHRWETEVHDEIRRFDIEEFVTVASTDDLTLGGVSDPREIAAKLWPLDEVAAKYQRFIDSYQAIPDRLEALHRSGQKISEAEFLPGALRIAIRFNQCFEIDPLLPPELLTRPWPGREAREILARCRKLGGLAREEKTGPALFRVFDEVIATLP